MRQAFAGLLWGKQFYHYDVAALARRRPGPAAAAAARRGGRNARWRTFDAFDVISMPDKWEYPWFAAWDLAFHCVALAHVDPAFAKYQLLLLCREWFQHPNGALPAYEWDFGDVNPPVHAWAALRGVRHRRRARPRLPAPGVRQAAGQLHLVGQPQGRRRQQPVRGRLPRAGQHRPDRPLAPARRRRARAVRRHRLDGDATPLNMADDRVDPAPQRPAGPRSTWCTKFLEHFAAIATPCDDQGLWDDEDGFFYDGLVHARRRSRCRCKVRSMVGVLPLLAASVVARRAR